MKKKLLFLLVPFLIGGLTGCVKYNGQGKPGGKTSNPTTSIPSEDSGGDSSSANPSTTSVTPPDPTHHDVPDDSKDGDKITVYLVFGQYGLYEGQPVNTNEDSLFLEHVKKVEEAVVGSDLPGKDKVTSSVKDSVFQSWVMYKNDGKLTEYTKVPAIDKAILYASFSGGAGGGSGSGSGGGVTPTPSEYKPSEAIADEDMPDSGFGFRFGGSHVTYMQAVHTDDYDGFKQYKLTNRAFKKNQEFTLYDFSTGGTWVVNVDPYSFGGTAERQTEWQSYLSNDGSKYTVLQDFNASEIYIKIKNEQDQVYFALGY